MAVAQHLQFQFMMAQAMHLQSLHHLAILNLQQVAQQGENLSGCCENRCSVKTVPNSGPSDVLFVHLLVNEHAGETPFKRAKQAQAKSSSATTATQAAPRLSATAKVKQTCSSCKAFTTPQWRHIKMPQKQSISSNSTSTAATDDDSAADPFITVCNACALRFRKRCCICAACKFIPSATYSGSSCSQCGGLLLQGRSQPSGSTTYHSVA